jgi:hypothetical protein
MSVQIKHFGAKMAAKRSRDVDDIVRNPVMTGTTPQKRPNSGKIERRPRDPALYRGANETK